MFNPITITIGKAVQALASLRGGGSALPGRIVEKINPHFAAEVLNDLPYGVVLVSGTNGKTTTVKIVSELLTAAGLRVFTNNTGSNFMRGVISSLLRKIRLNGQLDADIAVLELDEAHAVNFVEEIKPRYTLLLNVMRDQLDRFGEIDYTAQLLSVVARNTTEVLVLNSEDERLATIPAKERILAEVRWFGLAPELKPEFHDDVTLLEDFIDEEESSETAPAGEESSVSSHEGEGSPTSPYAEEASAPRSPDEKGLRQVSLLTGFSHQRARFEIDGGSYEATLALKGIYNAFNVTAALTLVHAIVPETPLAVLVKALSSVQSAFGRGEVFDIDGQPVEMILVKNPAGFRLALKSFEGAGWATMIAVNDAHGDGRDISWFFDVPFASLRADGVRVVTGSRAYDMALRLEYDEVPLGTVEPDIAKGVEVFLADSPGKPKRIYCSYTMMMALRTLLASKTEVQRIL